MDKYTPTPWKVGVIHGKRIKELWIHAEGYTCPVAYCNATNGIEAKAEANAMQIVKAVNCHEELTQALKKAELYLYTFTPAENKQDYINTLNQIKLAISKAESGI
jgi:hypothetical protein